MRTSLILALVACALTSACNVRYATSPEQAKQAVEDQDRRAQFEAESQPKWPGYPGNLHCTSESLPCNGGVLIHAEGDGTLIVWEIGPETNGPQPSAIDPSFVQGHIDGDRNDLYIPPGMAYGQTVLQAYRKNANNGKRFTKDDLAAIG